MPLYSWFLRKKTKNAYNELTTDRKHDNYIKNFTMWPTARIKPNIDETSLNLTNTDKSLPKITKVKSPVKIAHPAIKHAKS